MTTEQAEVLRLFALAVLEDHPEGFPEGPDMFDLLKDYGLLVEHTVTEPCGEGCNCEGYDDFPQTCYRPAEWLYEVHCSPGGQRSEIREVHDQ